MRVEILRAKLYRGNHCDVGQVTDMDYQTAATFIEKGWARPYVEPAPLTTAEAEDLIPTKIQRRRSLR
jgi:hypothetical protein